MGSVPRRAVEVANIKEHEERNSAIEHELKAKVAEIALNYSLRERIAHNR
jgi:hypothetical protein